MPRGDQTGPMGLGPMTGRRGGYCAGYATPGYANALPGRGLGIGFGGGRGWRSMFHATGLPGWQRFGAPALKVHADLLQKQLAAISKRPEELQDK